jgi:hypothetical protein
VKEEKGITVKPVAERKIKRDNEYQEKKTKIKKNQLRSVERDKGKGNKLFFTVTKTLCGSRPPP